MYHSIWTDSTISFIKKKEESWLKRTCPYNTSTSQCKHGHRTKRQAASQETSNTGNHEAPAASFKTKMCSHWLSGCYMGDRCSYAHRLEDLFKPFYTEGMIQFYQSRIILEIDRVYMTRLCKEICDLTCGDPNNECLFLSNSSMSNKEIQIHLPSRYGNMPHCTVTCKTCKTVKRIEIYSFTVLDKNFDTLEK